jgi:formate dehydrogenase subunit gamma
MDDESLRQLVDDFVSGHAETTDQLLPLLQDIQKTCGCVSKGAVAHVSDALNLSSAEVFGVVSFYDDLHDQPQPTTVDICGAEACQALGCRALRSELFEMLADSGVELRTVFCLGNCAVGPSARVEDQIIGRATVGRVKAAIDEMADGCGDR